MNFWLGAWPIVVAYESPLLDVHYDAVLAATRMRAPVTRQ